MSFSTEDPIFDAPLLDYLNPTTTWTELGEEDARVTVTVIVARCPLAGDRPVVRGEITESPAYIKAHVGRMIARDALGEAILEMVAGGHDVTVRRLEVQAGYLEVASLVLGPDTPF